MAESAKEKRRFWQVSLAYAVLKDPERRRIYNTHGWKGLSQSEAYAESSTFDICPYSMYTNFFSGVDPEDREYFLLNGAAPLSDDDEPEESEEDTEEEDNLPCIPKSIEKKEKVQIEDDPPPKPPQVNGAASIAIAMKTMEQTKEDVWSQIAIKIKAPSMAVPKVENAEPETDAKRRKFGHAFKMSMNPESEHISP